MRQQSNQVYSYPGESKKRSLPQTLVLSTFQILGIFPQIQVKTKIKGSSPQFGTDFGLNFEFIGISGYFFLHLLELPATFSSKCPGTSFWCGDR